MLPSCPRLVCLLTALVFGCGPKQPRAAKVPKASQPATALSASTAEPITVLATSTQVSTSGVPVVSERTEETQVEILKRIFPKINGAENDDKSAYIKFLAGRTDLCASVKLGTHFGMYIENKKDWIYHLEIRHPQLDNFSLHLVVQDDGRLRGTGLSRWVDEPRIYQGRILGPGDKILEATRCWLRASVTAEPPTFAGVRIYASESECLEDLGGWAFGAPFPAPPANWVYSLDLGFCDRSISIQMDESRKSRAAQRR